MLCALALAGAGEPPVLLRHVADVIPPRPPGRMEMIPPSPGVSYSWLAGHWTWDGVEWNWARGHYHATPPERFRYQPGHAESKGAVRSYVPGSFKAPPSDSTRGDVPFDPAQAQSSSLQH